MNKLFLPPQGYAEPTEGQPRSRRSMLSTSLARDGLLCACWAQKICICEQAYSEELF